MNKIDEILKLKELLDSGLINQNDFDRKKREIFEEANNESKNTNELISSEVHQNIQERDNNSFDKRKCPQCGSDNKLELSVCSVCNSDFSIIEDKVEPILENKSNISKYLYVSLFVVFILTSGIIYYMNSLKFNQSNKSTDNNDTISAPNSVGKQGNKNLISPNDDNINDKSNTDESINSNGPKLLRELESINEKNMVFTQCHCGAHDCAIEFKDDLGDLYEFMDSEITKISNYEFECPSGTKYLNKVFIVKYKEKILEYEDYPTETVFEIISISLIN